MAIYSQNRRYILVGSADVIMTFRDGANFSHIMTRLQMEQFTAKIVFFFFFLLSGTRRCKKFAFSISARVSHFVEIRRNPGWRSGGEFE